MDILVKQKRADGTIMAVVDGEINGSSIVEAKDDKELGIILSAVRDDDWKTINGAHVLIGKTGRILGGAGGKFTGKVFGQPFKGRKRVLKLQGKGRGKGQAGRKKEKGITIRTTEDAVKALNGAGIRVDTGDIRKLDKDLVVENTNQLLSLEKKFGLAKKTNIQITSVITKPDTIASVQTLLTNPADQLLKLTNHHFKDKDSLIKTQRANRDSGYNMRCSDAELTKYSVTHEYGHILQNVLVTDALRAKGWSESDTHALVSEKGYNFMMERTGDKQKATRAYFQPYETIRQEVVERCRSEIIAIAKKRNKKFTITSSISRYGKKDSCEFFAEVFANSQLSEPNELGEAMNIWLKQKGLC